MQKPVNLELNNSGSWKKIGSFDAADDEQTSLVLDAAETLVQTLHNSENPKGCPTLRVSMPSITDSTQDVLYRWEIQRGWYEAHTGVPV
jgi:hypothetical protein